MLGRIAGSRLSDFSNQGLAMMLGHVASLMTAGMHDRLGRRVTVADLTLDEMKAIMRQAFGLIFEKAPPFQKVTFKTDSAIQTRQYRHILRYTTPLNRRYSHTNWAT